MAPVCSVTVGDSDGTKRICTQVPATWCRLTSGAWLSQSQGTALNPRKTSSRCWPPGTTKWCRETGLGRKVTPRLCKLNPHACWGLNTKPQGCSVILGKSFECRTMSHMSKLLSCGSHMDTPPSWRCHIVALSSCGWYVIALPSWMDQVGALPFWIWHMTFLPSQIQVRWWTGHALQVRFCRYTAPVRFSMQLGSHRNGSGPEGHELGSKGDHLSLQLGPRVTIQALLCIPWSSIHRGLLWEP